MMTSDSDGPGTSTPCHSDKRAEQRRRLVGGELLDERGGAVVALTQHRRRQPLGHRLGGRAGRPHRREQPERPPARRGDEFGDLGQLLGGAGAVAARRRQVGCDVEDPGLGVLERRSDIDSAPGRFRCRPAPTPAPSRRTSRRRSASPRSAPRSSRRTAGCAAVRPPTAAPPAARFASSRGCPRDPARPRRCGPGSPARTTPGFALRCRRFRPGWRPPRSGPRRPWGRWVRCRWSTAPRWPRRAAR